MIVFYNSGNNEKPVRIIRGAYQSVTSCVIMLYLHSTCLSMFPISELKAQIFYRIIVVLIFLLNSMTRTQLVT